MSLPSIRIFLFIAASAAATLLPPWITLLIMVLLSVRYAAVEVLVLGLLMDFLWFTPVTLLGTASSGLGGLSGLVHSLPLFTLVALILVWGLEPLRNELLLS